MYEFTSLEMILLTICVYFKDYRNHFIMKLHDALSIKSMNQLSFTNFIIKNPIYPISIGNFY